MPRSPSGSPSQPPQSAPPSAAALPAAHREAVRAVPKMDHVLASPSLAFESGHPGRGFAARAAREATAEAREAALAHGATPSLEGVSAAARAKVDGWLGERPRRVVNATGVVLHTNLGRAPLSPEAAARVARSAVGYASLELDLASGTRGKRGAFVERALSELTGAEAALVVNNCAAAVLLVLGAVAMGRRVLVSRGELVEIGGGFRVPEVMARSGAHLVEVGTTNKTRAADYARELERGDVAAILRVHQGNFRQEGFVARPPLAELAELAQKAGVPLLEDLGGGALVDFAAHGLAGEPTVQASVEAGVDLVCFSTDKLLGGPQGGAVVGRSGLVERARRDPFARAVRMGRLPLVALEGTLEAYLAREPRRLPALDALLRPLPEVRARAEAWVTALAAEGVASEAVPLEAEVGGGALAGVPLASVGVALASSRPDALARALRRGDPAVLARVHAGQLVLDARTVLPGDDEALVGAVARAARGS